MNGPFLSERGIFSSYSSTRRNFTHCARRIFRNPRTGPATRCESGQKGHTKRVPCAFGIFSTITAHPALHKRNRTCGAGASFEPVFTTGLAARRGTAFRTRAARRGVRRCERRDALLAVIGLLSNTRRAGFILLLFFSENSYFSTQLLTSSHNHPVAPALLSRLRAQSRKTPGSLRVVALHAALSAAVRVIYRVHCHAAHRGTLSVPTRAARFPVRHVFVIEIAELTNRRHTIHAEFSHFTRWQLDQRKIAFLAQ